MGNGKSEMKEKPEITTGTISSYFIDHEGVTEGLNISPCGSGKEVYTVGFPAYERLYAAYARLVNKNEDKVERERAKGE